MTDATLQSAFRTNLQVILEDIRVSCQKVERDPREIRVIAVTKTVDESALDPLLAVGIREFGENRWQQAKAKLAHSSAAKAVWHFIGHLQLNKAKYIAPRFQMVHSVDSVEVAQALSHYRSSLTSSPSFSPLHLLLQVNVSGEATKSGLDPETVAQVAKQVLSLPNVALDGLMTMAPHVSDIELTRPVFRGLRDLRDEVSSSLGVSLPQLSMGMSEDFTVAVEEGATMVRLGRRLLQRTEISDSEEAR